MKRITAFFLLAMLCLSALTAFAEGPSEDTPPVFLPLGIWSLTGGENWEFITETAAALSPEQQAIAGEAGLTLLDGTLPANTAVPSDVLFAIFPGSETHFQLPQLLPDLALFSLTGEWYYGDDDILYYKHADGYAALTVDEVFALLNGTAPTGSDEKIIYLTIDDTPSKYTMDLLATLDRLDVKATFFVVGAFAKRDPIFLRAIYEQGHVIANHSYSHDAKLLSSSFKNCLNDFKRCEEAVANALGFPLSMPILRVPYGASTIPVAYRTQLQENGYMWIDWNALNGDTEPNIKSDEDVLARAIKTGGRYDGSIVMLVHDGKIRTIRTMEAMVKHFREQGYEFRTLDTNIERIEGVRMGFPK